MSYPWKELTSSPPAYRSTSQSASSRGTALQGLPSQNTAARPQNFPPEIQRSLDVVRSFTTACLARNCHFCQSKLTTTFSVNEWIQRWSTQATQNPKNATFLCAATCTICETRTCLGCGRSPRKSKEVVQVGGQFVNWCCHRGRLFEMWVLLARYDQVELEVQSAYSKQENSSTRSRISRTGTHDSRGIGYADLNGNPWANLNYTGVQGAQSALSTALQFFSMDERIDGFVTTTLKALQKMIPGPEHNNLPPELLGMLHLSKLIDKVAELLRNDSLEDITSRKEIYKAALQFVKKLGSHSELISLVQTPRHHKQQSPGLESLTVHANWKVKREDQQLLLGDKIPSVAERLLQLAKQSDIVLSAPEKEMLARESGQSMLDLCREVSEVYALIGATGSNSRQNKETQKIDEYQIFHQKNCLTRDDRILTARHAFMGMAMQMTQSPPGRMKRLIAELANMATSLPVGIYVKVSECRPDIMRCLVMGPPDSPYGYGLFDFDLFCRATYPHQPPLMSCRTAIDTRARLNPNLHIDGKVCLSLLGTWMDGDAAAQWQPGKSTILSVLISIQAMIFTEDPFRNEPGFTGSVGTQADRWAEQARQTAQPMTIAYGMLLWLEQPQRLQGTWGEIAKSHFRLNARKIMANVDRWKVGNSNITQLDPARGNQSLYGRLQKALSQFHF